MEVVVGGKGDDGGNQLFPIRQHDKVTQSSIVTWQREEYSLIVSSQALFFSINSCMKRAYTVCRSRHDILNLENIHADPSPSLSSTCLLADAPRPPQTPTSDSPLQTKMSTTVPDFSSDPSLNPHSPRSSTPDRCRLKLMLSPRACLTSQWKWDSSRRLVVRVPSTRSPARGPS